MNRFSKNRAIALASLLGFAGTLLAADETPTIKTPQAAVVTFTSGRSYRGTLTSVTNKDVRLRLKDGQAPARYTVAQIRSIRTVDDIYTFNAKLDRWEGLKATSVKRLATTEKPVAVKPASPLIEKTDDVRPSGKTQTVIAEGVGTSKEEALKDAFRTAIRKVVGELVVSKLTVKDDKLIEDKVLTYSSGIIKEGYKEISAKQDDELWRVKIAAKVEQRNLALRLVDAGFKVNIPVDGTGLAAAVLTRSEARKKATELIRDALADLPKIMVAEARKPTEKDYDEDKKELRIYLQVRADMKKYETFLKHLALILDKVNVGNDFVITKNKVARDYDNDGGPDCLQADRIDGFMHATLPKDTKGWFLWVLTGYNGGMTATRWAYYRLDSDFKKSVEPLDRKFSVLVTLLDKEGKEIVQEDVDLSIFSRGYATPYPWFAYAMRSYRGDEDGGAVMNVALAPVALAKTRDRLEFKPMKLYRQQLKVSEAELKRLDKIKCEVILRKPKPE